MIINNYLLLYMFTMLLILILKCTLSTYKKVCCPLAGVAQWIERGPENRKVSGLIPGQGTCWVVGQVPGWGVQEATNRCFSCT